MSVRQLFYRALKFGYPKNRNAYKRFDEAVIAMREDGRIPWSHISDPKRAAPRRTSAINRDAAEAVDLALTNLAPLSSVWGPLNLRPQLWVESTGMADALADLADDFEVALWCSSGYSSLTLLWECGQRRPTHLGILVDHDRAGFRIRNSIEQRHRQFCSVPPRMDWLGIRPEHIEQFGLERSYLDDGTGNDGSGTEPGGEGWPPTQLDAMDEQDVRDLAEAWLLSLLPPDTWEPYKAKRRAEQDKVDRLVETIRDDLLTDWDDDEEEEVWE